MNSRLALPKEHGAWSMLGYPFLIALILRLRDRWPASGGSLMDWLLLIAATALAYSAFHALRLAMRQSRAAMSPPSIAPRTWLSAHFLRHPALAQGLTMGALALLLAVPLMLRGEYRALCWLVTLGIVAVIFNLAVVRLRRERHIAGELFATLTLSMALPAALVVAFAGWFEGFAELWLLAWLFNASSIFYVKMCREVIAPTGSRDEFLHHRKQVLGFLAFSLALVLLLLATERLGFLPALALFPHWIMLRLGTRGRLHRSIRALGLALLLQSVLVSLVLGLWF